MSFLDDLLGKQIKKDGVILPQRKTLNIIGTAAVSVDDNTSTGETDLTIDTAAVADLSITTAKLANSAVTLAKIADNNVTVNKIGQQAAASVLGNATASIANVSALSGADGTILRRAGSLLGFGKILANFITGTSTNDNATAGDIGEVISSSIAFGSATSLVNATPKTVTSISLTAGDWDVSGVVAFAGSPTGPTYQLASISTTNNALGAQESNASQVVNTSTTALSIMPTPVVRLSLAATTTVYLTCASAFTGGTSSAYGTIRARRAR